MLCVPRKTNKSLWTSISFLFVILQADCQPADLAANSIAAPSANLTEPEVTTLVLRCLGICGDDEGEVQDPDKVVSYQWNLRVPVCAGLSCDTASCSVLDEKLGLLQFNNDVLDCVKHRQELQFTAGCSCTKPRPTKAPKSNDNNIGGDSNSSVGTNWWIAVIVSVIFVAICIGLYLGVRYDNRVEAKERRENQKSSSSIEEQPQ